VVLGGEFGEPEMEDGLGLHVWLRDERLESRLGKHQLSEL
jgi:hypothetical protein